MQEPRSNYGLVTLYHPAGVAVNLPTPSEPKEALDFVAKALGAGFLPRDPGAGEPGNERVTITSVVRRQKDNGDGTATPILDLYVGHEKMTHKVFARYLNTDADVAEWARMSGLPLSSLPLFESKASVEKTDALYQKYGRNLPRSVDVLLRPNPAHDPKAELKDMKPKWKWVGYAAAGAGAGSATDESGEQSGAAVASKPITGEKGTFACTEIEVKTAKNGNPCYKLVGATGHVFTFSKSVMKPITDIFPRFDLTAEGTTMLPFTVDVEWKLEGNYPTAQSIKVAESETNEDIPF